MKKAKQKSNLKLISFMTTTLLLLSIVLSAGTALGAVGNSAGNTSGNINNDGLAAVQGDWIYYRNDALNGNLYKIKTDGTGKTKLNDDDVVFINVVGDWIYYFDVKSRSFTGNVYHIYKIKTDGTKRTKIYASDIGGLISSMVVKDDWIYFDQIGEIYKMKTDGTKMTGLKGSGQISCIDGSYLYYYTHSSFTPGNGYRMKLDGTRKSKIIAALTTTDLFPGALYVDGNYVYFLNGSHLYKQPKDGNGSKSMVGDVEMEACNVSDGWIYFVEGDAAKDGYLRLYKMRSDGSGLKKLSDDEIQYYEGINVAGGWIYYKNSENEEFYRMKLDGTGCQLVEPY